MRLNPPRRIRRILYALTAAGTPFAAYLQARGLIGDLEMTLWSAEVAVVVGLAALNTGPTADEPQPVDVTGRHEREV